MRIAYVGPFVAWSDSPGLQRVLGVSAALASQGHEVTIGGQGEVRALRTPFPGVTLGGFGDVSRRSRLVRLMGGHGLREWLERLTPVPDAVIVYGGSGPFTRVVQRWAKHHAVPRVIDSVEWYETSHMAGGRLSPKAIDNEYAMRFRYPKYDGAIAISIFLERHYVAHGTAAFRVPPLVDVESIPSVTKAESGPIRLVYAGTPGKKDSLGTVVSALQHVDPLGTSIRLEVLGVDGEQATTLPGMPAGAVAGVEYFGRVSRAEVLARVAQADYIPLVRPDERFAHAGFPTKVVEAMAAGVAVIGNHTSDLAQHLRDMETGLVVEDDSVGSVADGLRRAVVGGRPLASKLGAAARQHAETEFHYVVPAAALSSWFERLCHDT